MIFETIISTVNNQGDVHVTPFGIQMEDELVVISPFKPSTTLENILTTKHAVINLTDDVRVFAGALTKRQAWALSLTEKISGYRLTDVLVHKELKLVKVQEDASRPQLFLEVLHEVQHQPFKGFNRAQAAVIELAVLASRLQRLPKDKVLSELQYLQIAVNKTAGERELQAWQWLIEKIDNFYAEQAGENFA
ncbi:MAG: DUF447 family protein [Methylotenera sp.]|nr:DUF447 family protein [Methylotenera sp.]